MPFGSKTPVRAVRRKKPRKEVAGPYQSESSVPSIRAKATKREHRKLSTTRTPESAPSTKSRAKAKARAKRRLTFRAPTKTTSPITDVLDAVKDVYEAASRSQPGGDIARDYVKGEAKNLAKAVEQGVTDPGRGRSPLHPPTAEQTQAALTLASLVPAGKAASVGEKALAKAISGASLRSSAEKVASKAAKGAKRKATRVRTAPKRSVRAVKAAPKKVKAAPRTAKRAVATSEGRRAAGRAARRKAYAHPLTTAAAASYASTKAGVEPPVVKQAGAFVEGHLEALKDNPIGTLKTTARAVPGIVTGPAAILGSAGSSVAHGTTEPLETEVKKQGKGLIEAGEKLFSGDPEKVKKSVEDEVGLSFVAPFPAVSRVRRTKVYRDKRGALRAKVAGKREGTRAKRRAELAAYKAGKRTKKPREPRHAVLDTATGEERILRRTGKRLEGRRQRIEESRAAAREKAIGERDALRSSRDVIRHIRRSKFSKGDHNIGDVLATVAIYGISRKQERAARQLDDIEASIGKADPDEIPPTTINDLRNIAWLREHPGAFTDKHFWRAVDAYKRQARKIEHSKRKRVLAISDVYGHARPEERLEAGVKVGGRTVATHFYKDPDTLARKQAELSDLRKEARLNMDLAAKASPELRDRHAAVAAEIAGRAKKLERDLKDYRAGFKQAQRDYNREAQATIAQRGYEQPAYVKDLKPPGGLVAEPGFPGGRSARKQHMAGMEQSRRGVVAARDFETLVNQSIAEPRMRRAMHRATTAFAERRATKVAGKRLLTSREIERAINRGELDESQYAVLHSQFFKQAILDPHKGGDEFLDAIRASSERPLREQITTRANDPGNKYIVVPKEAVREFVHQMEPPKGLDKMFGGANRFFTRLILGYSPAWAVAQIVAEGIPASLAIGANPARWARVAKYMAREERRLDDRDRAAIDGTVGESAGVTPHPQTQFKPDTNLQASRFFRLSQRNPVGRALLKGATGEALGFLDRWKGGKYRKAVAAAKADRELNGFVKSLSELMRGQRSIAEAIKGKPLAEQLAYMARHPKEAQRLESYLDDVMGNWRALTRHEAKLAPLIVFYPFLRYSLRWTFWSFPKRHPVKAQILYFLAQQNAEELEKLIGHAPANPIDYTFPIYTTSTGKEAVLPGGARIAPGMNALTTAIGKGRIESTATALNPAAGFFYTTFSGVDPFTGEKTANSLVEHGLLGLNQLLSMPAPARVDIPESVPLVGGDSLRDEVLGLLGKEEPSSISKTFEAMDPSRDIRSAVFPFAPQSGERYRDSANLGKALAESGYDPQLGDKELTAALEAINRGDTGPAKALRAKVKRSDRASDEITRLITEYMGKEGALPKLTDKQTEWLAKITGKRVFPYEPPKSSGNPYLDALDKSTEGNPYLKALKQSSGGNPYLKALE